MQHRWAIALPQAVAALRPGRVLYMFGDLTHG